MIVTCPKCGSTNVQRRGYSEDRLKWRYECQENHEEFVDENGYDYRWFRVPVDMKQEVGKAPKIFFWDIENSGMLVENVWNLWEPKLNFSQIKGQPFLLSWSGKFLYDDTMYSDVVKPSEAKSRDDRRICESLWKMLDSADIIVAHNGDSHDIPKSNSRFLYHGFVPPMYDRSLDTLKIARSIFDFPSNSLANINAYLGLEDKIHNEPGLFDSCVAGNSESLKKLRIYNEQDVICVESLYLKMRPWIKNHPNWTIYGESDGNTCPQCGKSGITWRNDKLNKGIYKVARCNSCGAPIRSRIGEMTKDKRKNTLYRVS